jgi:predicted RNase H-like nuclease
MTGKVGEHRMKIGQNKHEVPIPNPRGIRRACGNELYRTVKRLKTHVPAELLKEAQELYVKRVIGHLEWISAHHSNRKALADWWDEALCAEIAVMWKVEQSQLSKAFRDAFGG